MRGLGSPRVDITSLTYFLVKPAPVEMDSPQPSRRYTEMYRSRSLGHTDDGCGAQDEVAAVMSLHPALGSIRVSSRRHSSAPSPREVRGNGPSRRSAPVGLKPLVLTPARTLSTPLTTSSSKSRRLSTPSAPSACRRYSTPTASRSDWSQKTLPKHFDDHSNHLPGMRRRSIGYHGEGHGEHSINLYVVRRSGSTSSESTVLSSDFSRRGSADTCDTEISTPSSSPEKPPYLDRNRLPSLQTRFDPQRGLSLDVVLENEDDSFEPVRVQQEEEQAPPFARYREFWGEEAARNESAFQDVCLALDELAPAFPSSSLLSSRSFSSSASPLSRSGSTTSEDSGSPRTAAARRGKPIVIQPSNGRSTPSSRAHRSRRISRNRLAQVNKGESDLPALPIATHETANKPATGAPREQSANARPVSSANAIEATQSRGPRPLVWPPPNETKRLSLAPPLAYDSDGDSESLETSDAESDEKVWLHRRVAFVPRPPRTRDQVETGSGDFLDFLLNESPVAPASATVRLDQNSAKDSAPKPPAVVSSPRSTPQSAGSATAPKSRGLASRFWSSFGSGSQPKVSETSPKSLKKRPSSFMGRSKPATPAPAAPTRSRPVISGPLELEATESLRSTSSRESFNSVSTISLSQAQRSRSASVEVGRVPLSPTAVAAAVRGSLDHDSVSEELLTLYTQIAPSSSSKVSVKAPSSVPLSPSGSAKQLPAPPLLLSPLWSLPVTDLPRTPLAWAERPLHRSPSMSSVATNGTTTALIDSYA